MHIVCDENIPLATELFGHHGQITRVDGRTLTRQVLLDTGADALIVRSVTKVNASLIANTAVSFVGSCTIGVDHLDTVALQDQGTTWCNAPGSNAQSVVEYVVSALVAVDKLNTIKTCAVIGCGNVGSAVARELRLLGIEVCAYDPFLAVDPNRPSDIPFVGLPEAMSCDLVSLHTPLTHGGAHPTFAMIGHSALAHLPQDAVVLAAGRGGVLVEEAMVDMAKKRADISWVLDVWENEPCIDASAFAMASIATPHVAGYSLEGKQNGTWQVYQKFCERFHLPSLERPVSGALVDIDVTNALCRHGRYTVDECLKYLALQVYDPRRDQKAMEDALFAPSQDEEGRWFDRLRRNYPVRRERSAYRFHCAGPKQADVDFDRFAKLMHQCKQLGFTVSP